MKIFYIGTRILIVIILMIIIVIVAPANRLFDINPEEKPGIGEIYQDIDSLRSELASALINYYQGNGDINKVKKIKSEIEERMEMKNNT